MLASPDTDELATLPLPAATPEPAPPRREKPEGAEGRPAAPEQVTREAESATSAGAAGAETAPHDLTGADRRGAREAEGAASAEAETAPHDLAAAGAAETGTGPQDRVEPERIEPEAETPAVPAKERGRWWRGFTGSLAAGLAVLALGVLVVAGVCLYTGAPGPGATLLVGHPVAAVLALLAQRVADRRNGPAAVGAGAAVVLFAVSALTLFWLT
ncbi:hypothetical protein [Amycolatopsis sp. cg9]|uniref:hypothetical protein n=1 Tax=Amycolatopsis sp. cg9 TaxID=3238801 RepID=UPI0035264246